MYGESLCVGTRLSPDGVRLLAPPDFFLLLWILKYKKGLVALFQKAFTRWGQLSTPRGSFTITIPSACQLFTLSPASPRDPPGWLMGAKHVDKDITVYRAAPQLYTDLKQMLIASGFYIF